MTRVKCPRGCIPVEAVTGPLEAWPEENVPPRVREAVGQVERQLSHNNCGAAFDELLSLHAVPRDGRIRVVDSVTDQFFAKCIIKR